MPCYKKMDSLEVILPENEKKMFFSGFWKEESCFILFTGLFLSYDLV